ncbi:uncharacterized protein [Rutidosis leptorrhynchoides]|uniref:uncharacterized protein n=1 Tax=Rutidosis leptorrhynchoides TaxID=125765 RepID=UPI003A99A910
MPVSPGMRYSPGRERRVDNHKRGRSLENGIVYKQRDDDDDLALFNEVQIKESDTFLLQSNDDFEDTFATKLRHFADHKLGINVTTRGESSDLLNVEDEKNDYEWLITPPDTPLFASLDDETPQVNLPQRGRPRAQPISISRSSTMEKSHRSSRGSASPNRSSPNRLSPSPQSRESIFQPRGRASSVPNSSPPPTRRPVTGSRRPSPPSSKPSTPPRNASTPTSRRLSTGSVSTISTSAKIVTGNSTSPKIKAWQANIPGFSTEAPPNLRTSLADRPASYVRGSSPASRNGRHSMSLVGSRNMSLSHNHDRDDVEYLHSVTVDGSERSNSKKVSSFRNKNALVSQKPIRAVSSSSAPKRSFDMALRKMDHRKGPQNMFRPLLSSVPTSNFYAGKPSPAWNSSVTTSSNASSDLGTSGPCEIEEYDRNGDDATSGYVKDQDCNIDDEIFMFEKPNEGEEEDETCSRCGCSYSVITQTEDVIKLCPDCRKSNSALTISQHNEESTMSNEDHELVNTLKPQMTLVRSESTEVSSESETTLVKDGESTHLEESQHDMESQTTLVKVVFPESTYEGSEQIQCTVDSPKSKADYLEGEGISIVLKRSTSSIRRPVIQSGNFSACSISHDDLSYARASTNSMRSLIGGRGSVSASSSVDFGPRFQRQLSSRKSDIENYKFDPMNVKYRRSVSSVSGTSSHAFHPSSVGTSAHDHLEIDIVDSLSEGRQENPSENEGVSNVETILDSRENLLPESSDNEEPKVEDLGMDTSSLIMLKFEKVEDVGTDTSAITTCTFEKVEDVGTDIGALTTCTFEEDSSVNHCVETTDFGEVQLDAISEGEVGHSCCSSPSASQCSERNVEEVQKYAAAAMDCETLNHSTNIMEESVILVEGEGGTKGRSLTLEEATDTILFCSSIVHNLAYEAATLAIEKQTTPDDNTYSFPLIPAVAKGGYSGPKEVQPNKTSKPSSKSQKKKKTMEKDNMIDSNRLNNVGEVTDVSKTSIVYANNKENMLPPKLESKCNCIIM